MIIFLNQALFQAIKFTIQLYKIKTTPRPPSPWAFVFYRSVNATCGDITGAQFHVIWHVIHLATLLTKQQKLEAQPIIS